MAEDDPVLALEVFKRENLSQVILFKVMVAGQFQALVFSAVSSPLLSCVTPHPLLWKRCLQGRSRSLS